MPMGGIKTISLKGEVETMVTLEDLKTQAGDLNSFETLVLDISSQGGCVEEGLQIMVWLDMLSKEGKEVITVVSANAYSIASLIMLVADKRYISKHGEVMVHNPMIPFIEYANANELEAHINELRGLEDMLQQLYVNFASISQADIKVLMDNETYLSPDEAVLRGFADKVIDIKPKPYSMMAIKKQINMSKTKNMLNIVIAAVNGSDVVNQMYYNTKGDELQIYQANPAKYAIGDKTSMEAGDVRLSDGTMISIVNFEITNIEKEIEAAPEVAPIEEVAVEAIPEGEVKEVEEVAPVAAEFNEGPAPKDEDAKAVAVAIEEVSIIDEAVAVAVESIEVVAQEVVAEVVAEEVVAEAVAEVVAEEVVASKEEVAIEEVASVEEVIAEVEASQEEVAVEEVSEVAVEEEVIEEVIEEEIVEEDAHQIAMDKMSADIDMMMARIAELESLISKSGEFEALATEAIDSLARNTSSAFKPEARKVEVVNAKPSKGNSIFSRMARSNKQ
jgi:ATP-dependent protease ClpP protease subunit